VPSFGNENVPGLDVAMHNAGSVSDIQRVSNFDRQ